MAQPDHYAHTGNGSDRKNWHRLAAHLEGTGTRAAAFLDAVGGAEIGRVAGLLHDLGKYSKEFQRRLETGGGRVNHSTAGAKVAIDRYENRLGKMLAFCIAGHHAGLANGVNGGRITALADRLLEEVPLLNQIWEDEIDLPVRLPTPHLLPRGRDAAGFCASFFIRMLFSALVDADYLDTEAYYAELEGTPKPRGQHPDLRELRDRLASHLGRLAADAVASPVNDLRREVLIQVCGKALEAPGLFSLTVPTGGGKTLASLAFALDHALHHRLARVIYVIPYMSIIEQTASVFREALRGGGAGEADFVIEHHSTFDEDSLRRREARDKLRLAMENWDAPIIVTTAVQFFESLFASRPSRCRKLHNIASSVVILDEAQTLPPKYLRPCVTVLDELARNWRTSVVLCTATQPALTEADGFRGGFENVRELAPAPQSLYKKFRRTRIVPLDEPMDDAELAERLHESPQALAIVNTRRHARELYERIQNLEGAAHLTTLMCARHRQERLEIVRERLRNGVPVRLIATSLVEAGVDVDFPVVWRSEAGLESIIQAAGRCNREGRSESGDVFVFEPAGGEGRKPPPDVGQSADAFRSVLRCHREDPASLDAIEGYFKELYWVKGADALDQKGLLRLIAERGDTLDFPFEAISEEFRVIETPLVPVIVPYQGGDGDDDTVKCLIEELKWVERPSRIARRLQPYVVQIPPHARASLLAVGAANPVRSDNFDHQFVVLSNLDLYSTDVGLTWDDPTFREPEGLLF